MTFKHQHGGTTDNNRVVGIVTAEKGVLKLRLCNKKKRNLLNLDPASTGGLKEGDVIVGQSFQGGQTVKVTKCLGHKSSPGIITMVGLYENGLRHEFNQAAIKEADTMTVPDLQGREDLRSIPLVTVDGEDSKDFDDAIFAEKTKDGGFHLIVAIADVSYYVRPGSELDKEAQARGTSVYLPDRCIPMLPEKLSNDLCSLRPNEDRACMAFHLYIDKDGKLTNYRVNRALMRSAARLTYKQVQVAKDGKPDAMIKPLMDKVINPVYEAFNILHKAREARGALGFNSEEYKIEYNKQGQISGVKSRERYESCKVIEEFAILTNVAAANLLEGKHCVYRVHATPNASKNMAGLRDYLTTVGFPLPEGDINKASMFNSVLKQSEGHPESEAIKRAIMRVQSAAEYSTDNQGHFGLALTHYAHSTSPIRRYADLLVHRSLVETFNMGAGSLSHDEKSKMEHMAEHISKCGSMAAKTERQIRARTMIQYLASKKEQNFDGRVSGMNGSGLFVRLQGMNVEGFLPISKIGGDFFEFSAADKTMIGRKGTTYSLGDDIKVKLKEADALTDHLIFHAANDNSSSSSVKNNPGHKKAKKFKGPRR